MFGSQPYLKFMVGEDEVIAKETMDVYHDRDKVLYDGAT